MNDAIRSSSAAGRREHFFSALLGPARRFASAADRSGRAVAEVRAASRKPGRDDGGVDVAEKPATRQKLQRPRLYQVLLHNDDYTPMEFVVLVLLQVFHKSESDAHAIMLQAHQRGSAVAGVYTFEVAETKVDETMKLAAEAGFPLLVTLEPAEGDAE
jgi:ATP-dependent Clp protease adaptor protein ClpS